MSIYSKSCPDWVILLDCLRPRVWASPSAHPFPRLGVPMLEQGLESSAPSAWFNHDNISQALVSRRRISIRSSSPRRQKNTRVATWEVIYQLLKNTTPQHRNTASPTCSFVLDQPAVLQPSWHDSSPVAWHVEAKEEYGLSHATYWRTETLDSLLDVFHVGTQVMTKNVVPCSRSCVAYKSTHNVFSFWSTTCPLRRNEITSDCGRGMELP